MKEKQPKSKQVQKGKSKCWTTNSALGKEESLKNRQKIRDLHSQGIGRVQIEKEFDISKAQFYRIIKDDYQGPQTKGKKSTLSNEVREKILMRIIYNEKKKNEDFNFQKIKKGEFISLLQNDIHIRSMTEGGQKKKSSNFYYPEYSKFMELYKNFLQNYNSKFIAEPNQAQLLLQIQESNSCSYNSSFQNYPLEQHLQSYQYQESQENNLYQNGYNNSQYLDLEYTTQASHNYDQQYSDKDVDVSLYLNLSSENGDSSSNFEDDN